MAKLITTNCNWNFPPQYNLGQVSLHLTQTTGVRSTFSFSTGGNRRAVEAHPWLIQFGGTVMAQACTPILHFSSLTNICALNFVTMICTFPWIRINLCKPLPWHLLSIETKPHPSQNQHNWAHKLSHPTLLPSATQAGDTQVGFCQPLVPSSILGWQQVSCQDKLRLFGAITRCLVTEIPCKKH